MLKTQVGHKTDIDFIKPETTMKKVSPEQIKQIEAFLIKKEIVYCDLQQEFLDHICSSIEEQWEEGSDISFDKAFNNEYNNFGIFGFSEILEKREKNLQWYYWKQLGLHGLNWFKIPQLFFALLLFYSIYEILSTSYNIIFVQCAVGAICLLSINQMIRLQLKQRKKIKEGKPVFLIDKVIAQAAGYFFIIYIPMLQNSFFMEPTSFSTIIRIVCALIITLFIFMTYIIIYDFPKNKKQYFKNKYRLA